MASVSWRLDFTVSILPLYPQVMRRRRQVVVYNGVILPTGREGCLVLVGLVENAHERSTELVISRVGKVEEDRQTPRGE